MRILIFLLLSFSLQAQDVDITTECHWEPVKAKRWSCHNKRMELLKKELELDKKTWKKEKNRADKLTRIKLTLLQKRSHIKMLEDEIKIIESHKQALESFK